MVKFSSSVSLFTILLAINVVVAKERCDACLPSKQCQLYGNLNKYEQQMWRERYKCGSASEDNGPDGAGETKDFLVCCPENIWGVSNSGSSSTKVDSQSTIQAGDSKTDADLPESLEHNLDDISGDTKFKDTTLDNRRPNQNPYFQPARGQNEGKTNSLCPPTLFPPDFNSRCCGLEASDSESNQQAQYQKIRQQPPTTSTNRPPRRYNRFPMMPNSFFPSWMGFRDEDDSEDEEDHAERKKRQANNTVTVSVDNRIAGGKETDLKQFPWTVLLKTTFKYPNKESAFSCGGSLISSRYVLTAGHCVFDPEGTVKIIEVTLAEYDKRTFPKDCKFMLSRGEVCVENVVMYAEHFTIHPEYNDERLLNDIALIRLRGNAPYTDYIRPICLPTVDVDTPELSNLKLTATGWGRNGLYKSDVKQSTVVNLVPQNECKKSYPNLTRRQVCAAGYSGEDTCKGDSGGPLMVAYKGKYQVSGVVSGKRSDAPCGTSVPSLYTNVYQYVPWIRSVIYKRQS